MPVIELSDERLFGKDLNLTDAGDLDVATNNGFRDLKVISGRPSLRQALLIRLATDPGDLPQHKSYGSNLNELGSQGMKQAKELALQAVNTALNDEPRVKKVDKVVFTDIARDSFEINVTVSLQNSDVPLNLVFPYYLKA